MKQTAIKQINVILGDLREVLSDEELAPICQSLIQRIFDFSSVLYLDSEKPIDGDQFLKLLVASLVQESCLSLTEDPLLISNLPSALTAAVRLRPLVGVNICRAESVSDGQILPYFIIWNNISNQSSDLTLLIINTDSNEIFYLPTKGKLKDSRGFSSIYISFLTSLPIAAWFNSRSRRQWLCSLEVAQHLSCAPHKYIVNHFGHYVINNLAHLSCLEELGITNYFRTIYRTGPHDYFILRDECRYFHHTTSSKFKLVKSFEDAKAVSAQAGEALITSKGARLNTRMSSNIRKSFTSENYGDNPIDQRILKICIGVRGGSREALNLVQAIEKTIDVLFSTTRRNIILYIDGMSRSSQNNKSTTRYLSLERELATAKTLHALEVSRPWLNVKSLVNLALIDQLKYIATCDVAISHWGSSELKYVALAGCPTIVHGKLVPYVSDRHYVSDSPESIFFGPEYITEFVPGPDMHRQCYNLDLGKMPPALAEVILSKCAQKL